MAVDARGWRWAAPGFFGAVVLGLAAALALPKVPRSAAAAQPAAELTAFRSGPSEAQVAELRIGLNAAAAGDWNGVRSAYGYARAPLVRRILLWRLASEANAPPSFEEIAAALDELAGWPRRGSMRRRAEQAIFDAGLGAEARIAFLRQEAGPLTGDGKAALALALARLGQSSEALATAKDAYRNHPLTPRAEGELLRQFGASIEADDHAARAHIALWRDDAATASRLLPRLSGADRRVVEARIALQRRNTRGLQPLVDAASAVRGADPGLLYDRARYIRRAGRPEDALPIIALVNPAAAPRAAQEALSVERRLFIPRALRMGQTERAYRLAAEHQLERGVSFAESEWWAGFIAFRFLNDLQKAERHFAALRDNVSTPVSLSRAHYWLGRTAERRSDFQEAQVHFTEAATYGFTYYGQLAAEKLGDGANVLSFINGAAPGPAEVAAFEGKEQIQALRLLAAAGGKADFEALAFGLDDLLETPAEHELLSAMARAQGYTKTAVRSAKAGLRRGVVAGTSAYPVLDLPSAAQGSGRAEPALVHAITRQESEFDPSARSGADARGLMQIIPGTASATARRIGSAYSGPSALYDPELNLTLGSAYLQQLVEQFDGSYVLAIAAYNAGPSRSWQWLSDWGDPRTGAIDPVEWVELIPFEETRNYVQRVMENLQVYRHRLAGEPTALRLTEDLRRGGSS